jgi:hypothetical protein
MVTNQRLRQLLVEHFDESELRDLTFDLNVDYENLGGSGKSDKARALIGYLKRRGRLEELITLAQRRRSHVAWTDEPSPEPSPSPEAVASEETRFRDNFSRHETGLSRLLAQLGENHPRYADALVYQQRLSENIEQTRRYGDTEARRADRAEIIDRLNEVALASLGVSFIELSQSD